MIGGELKYQETELLDAKWFSLEDLEKLKDEEIRISDLRKTIEDLKNKELIPLDRINIDFIDLKSTNPPF